MPTVQCSPASLAQGGLRRLSAGTVAVVAHEAAMCLHLLLVAVHVVVQIA